MKTLLENVDAIAASLMAGGYTESEKVFTDTEQPEDIQDLDFFIEVSGGENDNHSGGQVEIAENCDVHVFRVIPPGQEKTRQQIYREIACKETPGIIKTVFKSSTGPEINMDGYNCLLTKKGVIITVRLKFTQTININE